MGFAMHQPAPPLRALVQSIWSADHEASGAELPGLIAPDSHAEFVFQFGAPCAMQRTGSSAWEPQPRAMLFAQRRRCVRLRAAEDGAMVAFRTSPVVACLILGRSLEDLWDQPVALRDLLGPAVDAFADQLTEATPAQRFARIEDWLRTRLTPWDAGHAELERLHAQLAWQCNGTPLRAVAARWGVSERSLRRRVGAVAGLSPKQLERSGRILRACAWLQEHRHVGIAAIAYELGFADHAAFAHAFREQTGLTPQAFRAEPLAFYERGPG